MSAPMFDQWPQTNQSFLEPLMELNQINMRLYGDVAREHLKAMNELVQCQAEQMQELSQAKKWEEWMAIQANWVPNVSKPLNTYAQHMLNTMLECTATYSKWMEKSCHQQGQKMQKFEQEKHKGDKR